MEHNIVIRKLTQDVENEAADRRHKAKLRQPVIPAGTLLEVEAWDEPWTMGAKLGLPEKVLHCGEIRVHPKSQDSRQDRWERVGIRDPLYQKLLDASEPVKGSTKDELRHRNLHHYAVEFLAAMIDEGRITFKEIEEYVDAKETAETLMAKA